MLRFHDRWEPVMTDDPAWVWGQTTVHEGQLCQHVGYEQWTGCLFRLPVTVPVRIEVDFTRLTGQADACLWFGVVDAERLAGYHVQYNYYYDRFALCKKVGPRWGDWVEVEGTRTPQVWDTMPHRHELVIGAEGQIVFSEDGRVRITWQDPDGFAIGTAVYVFLRGYALGYGGAEAHTHWQHLQIVSLGSSGAQEVVEEFEGYEEGATLDQWLPGMVGVSEPMRRVTQLVERVKDTEATVLVTGETGTGKELIARAIHEQGRRRERPFVAVNCAALPKDLMESELFGHGKGAFTGAVCEQPGLFEAANGGTLFLDEITELGGEAQAKLLRVLEDKEIRRVGGTKTRRVDVRIIVATSRNLLEEMDAGRFRPELYYRLDMVRIYLPPLRERREDIPFLVYYFLTEASKRLGKPVRGCVSQAGMPLMEYDWPGNVRELRHEVERLVLMVREDGIIWPEDVSEKIRRRQEECALEAACGRRLPELSFHQAMDQYKRWLVETAMKECGGNVTQTAKRLGLTRQNLQWLMGQLGVKRGDK